MDFSAFILVLSLFLISSPTACATLDTLRKGSSLHVEKIDNVLISPNGVFSAGFHSVGDNAFSFAIWFTKSSPRTIIWMANRDQPVNGRASKLSLFEDGNLVLIDGRRNNLWTTNTISSSPVQLDLLNTGNLVLHTMDGVTLWQSFDSPTDTLLPYQTLTKDSSLKSSRSKTNYSVGYYQLYFDNDNVLRLGFDGPNQISSIYWPDPWLLIHEAGRSWENSSRLAVLDPSGHFTSSDKFEFSSSDLGIGPQRRLTLDFDGNLRLYSLDDSRGTWVVSWLAFPQPCKIHGVCGSNSLCTYDANFGGRCSCLPGYMMKTPHDWSFGCEAKFSVSFNEHEDDFLRISQVDFFGYNYLDSEYNTFEGCKEICLNLSDCMGFQYRTISGVYGRYLCYPKKLLRNGYRSPSFDGDLYMRVPRANLQSYYQPIQGVKLDCSVVASDQQRLNRTYEKRQENRSLKLLIWFACALGGLEITCIFLVWLFLFMTYQESDGDVKGYHLAGIGFRKFTYTDLKNATKGFTEEIGRGGAGVVYKGLLSDKRVAAIKRLEEASQGGEAEFLAEVSTLGRLNHMNLIDMWGYCTEGKHRLLVYEYMELGSLAKNLSSNALDWEKRFNIAVGTAKGLAYLHEECLEWVLHCDVKPQNILLDSEYQPKVADFGLSKLLNRGGTNNSSFSRMRGTRGYMAPEWFYNLPITSKVDVYSFGIVCLELVTGKDPLGKHPVIGGGETDHKGLVAWVREKINEAAMSESSWIEEITDPMLEGKYNKSKMEILCEVALQCVEEDKDARPTMSEVVEILMHHENPAKLESGP